MEGFILQLISNPMIAAPVGVVIAVLYVHLFFVPRAEFEKKVPSMNGKRLVSRDEMVTYLHEQAEHCEKRYDVAFEQVLARLDRIERQIDFLIDKVSEK